MCQDVVLQWLSYGFQMIWDAALQTPRTREEEVTLIKKKTQEFNILMEDIVTAISNVLSKIISYSPRFKNVPSYFLFTFASSELIVLMVTMRVSWWNPVLNVPNNNQ